MSKISKYYPNASGVDYICADIHGHFSLLEKRMQQVNFNYDTDRLFSLGDLIDRGDESYRALEFLSQPWFHAIVGNHELMLIKAYETNDPQVLQWWYYWGGDWAQDLSIAELKNYCEAFKQLPIAIELCLNNELTVGLVHAELPVSVSWRDVCEKLANIPSDEWQLEQYNIAAMVWSKSLAYYSEQDKKKIKAVTNINHVFHGHSIMYNRPLTVANRTYMDLGSYETGEIGFIDPLKFVRTLAE